MDKALIQRAIKVALIFMIVFFLLNYFTMKHSDLMHVVGRTLLATLAFFIIYIVAFTILSSDERKMISVLSSNIISHLLAYWNIFLYNANRRDKWLNYWNRSRNHMGTD